MSFGIGVVIGFVIAVAAYYAALAQHERERDQDS